MKTRVYLKTNGKLRILSIEGFYTHKQLKPLVYKTIGPYDDGRFMVVYR